MEDRLKRLQERVAVHQLAFNRATTGRNTRLLLERKGRRAGQMIGRSPWLQSVHVETDAPAGEIIDITLVSAGPNSMAGAPIARVAA